MTLVQKLFGTTGRIRRLDYWLLSIGVNLAVVLLAFAADLAFEFEPGAFEGVVFFWSIRIFMIWTRIAIAVKRCHDRDKAWWWALVFEIPLIGWVWGFIELGCLDGTPGPNRFGPSPKGYGGAGAELTAEVFS